MTSTLFLTREEVATLTGRRIKSKQIELLLRQGIPFRVSATGHPVVTRLAIEGRPVKSDEPAPWTPAVLVK